MRFPWQRYYIKKASQSELAKRFDENYWMGITSDYGCSYLAHPPERLRYFGLLKDIILSREPASVVEVGCARGDVLKLLKEATVPVAGIDISPWAVEHRVIEEVRLGEAQHLPFPDKSFDLYFSHDVMEHIPAHEIPQVASEIRRVARRALLVISCRSLIDDIDPTHVSMMPIEWWEKQLLDGHFPMEIIEKPGQAQLNWPTAKRMWRRLWLK